MEAPANSKQSQNFEQESLEKIELKEKNDVYNTLVGLGIEIRKVETNLRKKTASIMLKLCDDDRKVQGKAVQDLKTILSVATEYYQKLNSEYEELKASKDIEAYEEKKKRLEELANNPYLGIKYIKLEKFLTKEFLC